MLKHIPVHVLWVSGGLSRLARLSLASFLSRGYRVTVWSYEPQSLAGCGAEVRGAEEILPLETGDRENMAWLTSLFRYRVLAERGGLWSDLDVVALGEPVAPWRMPFVASEKRRPVRHGEPTATGESLTQVTNCFMANPHPRAGDLWHRATDVVTALIGADRSWENSGPHLLSRLMLAEPAHGVAILAPEAVDPVAWWNVPGMFLEDRPPPRAPFMHMYATVWARRGVDAEQPFPKDSMIGRMWTDLGL